jgi:hypothetical protein
MACFWVLLLDMGFAAHYIVCVCAIPVVLPDEVMVVILIREEDF